MFEHPPIPGGAKKDSVRSGVRYETDLVGEATVNKAAFEHLSKVSMQMANGKKGAKVKDLIRYAELAQPASSLQKPLVKELRDKVILRLKLDPTSEAAKDVKVFPTIHTPLDNVGVDLYIKFPKDTYGDVDYIGIDVTLRNRKPEGPGADVVATDRIPDPAEGASAKTEFEKRIDEIAFYSTEAHRTGMSRYQDPRFQERVLTWNAPQ